jgi:hypothetical protein
MKTIILSGLFIFFAIKSQAQRSDTTALQVVNANLRAVSNFLDKKDTSLQKISDAIQFLNELTGIPSENYGKYYGQFRPTPADLKAWKAWVDLNGLNLFWDKEVKSVLLYKKVKTNIF